MALSFLPRLRSLRFTNPVRSPNRSFSAEAIRSDPPFSLYEANTRLRNLVQSNRLADARLLFEEMPHRDEISYTILVSAYVRDSAPRTALTLVARALADLSLPPADSFLLSLALKASASPSHPPLLSYGECLHTHVVKYGFLRSSAFVSTALLDMYSKTGSTDLALQVFHEMPPKLRNPVAWTGVVTALVRAARPRDALQYFVAMGEVGVPFDSHTYAVVCKACADAGLLTHGREIHARVTKVGLDATPFVANTLAAMYMKCGDLRRGLVLVERMRSPDVAAYTTAIATYVRMGREKDAIEAFVKMRAAVGAAAPNDYTYAAVVSACVGLAAVAWGEQVHAHVTRQGFAAARSVANSLVTLYARAGRLADASAAFRESPVKDIVSWSAIISGYACAGLVEEAFLLFGEMRRRKEGSPPPPPANEFTYASLLSTAAAAAALGAARQVHTRVIAAGLDGDAMVASALVTAYSKGGCVEEASRVFVSRRRDDVVTWTAMINGYAEHGRSAEAVVLFDTMAAAGLRPDGIAFIGVLTACCHAGLVDKGMEYFRAMKKEFGVEPAKEHYGCVVDLLGRAGRAAEAERVIGEMPEGAADGVVWTAVLRAWAAKGEEEKGRAAAEKVMEAEDGAGAAVALANLYAEKGRWGDVAEVRRRMREAGVRKEAGWSWVEVGGDGAAVFSAGDRSHAREEEIYAMLGLVYKVARKVANVY